MSSETDVAHPGSIIIESAKITNFDGSKSYDLKFIIVEFSIFESLNKPYLTANFVINDAGALTTQLPLIGQETITIKFKTPESSFTRTVEKEFKVIAVTDYSRISPDNASYTLQCASSAFIKDLNTKIRKAYQNMTISDMVKTIAKDYLGIDEMKTLEETEGERTIVIPSMTPANALNFLCREAKSSENKSSVFHFYENIDGFHFQTTDKMIKDDANRYTEGSITTSIINTTDYYYATDYDFNRKSYNEVNTILGLSIGDSNTQSMRKPYEFKILREYSFKNIGNGVGGMKTGAFENTVAFFDPITDFYEEKTYKYMDESGIFSLTSASSEGHMLTSDNEYIKDGKGFVIFEPTNHIQQNEYKSDTKYETMNYKIGAKAIYDNVVANITIPGDSDKSVGQLINLKFPEFGANDDVEGQINKYVSGQYIIQTVRHFYSSTGGYYTIMTVAKNAFENSVSSSVSKDTEQSTSQYDEENDASKQPPDDSNASIQDEVWNPPTSNESPVILNAPGLNFPTLGS